MDGNGRLTFLCNRSHNKMIYFRLKSTRILDRKEILFWDYWQMSWFIVGRRSFCLWWMIMLLWTMEVVKLLLSKWQNQKATIGWRLLISASCYCVYCPQTGASTAVFSWLSWGCDNITTAPIIAAKFLIMRFINRVTSLDFISEKDK